MAEVAAMPLATTTTPTSAASTTLTGAPSVPRSISSNDTVSDQLRRSETDRQRLEMELVEANQELSLLRRQMQREHEAHAEVEDKMQQLLAKNATPDAAAISQLASRRTSLAESHSKFLQDEVTRLESELKEAKIAGYEGKLRQESAEHEILGYRKEIQALEAERDALLALIERIRSNSISPDALAQEQIASLKRQLANAEAQLANRPTNGISELEYQRCINEILTMREELAFSQEQTIGAQRELAERARNAKLHQDSLSQELHDLRLQLTELRDAYQQAVHEANMLREQLRRQQMGSPMSSHSRSTLPVPRRVHVSGVTGWTDGMFTIPTNGPKGAYLFPVYVDSSPASLANQLVGPAWLRVTDEEISFLDQNTWQEKAVFHLEHIRRFGRDAGILSFEVGRKCPLGEGVYYVGTIHMLDIFDVLSRYTRSQ